MKKGPTNCRACGGRVGEGHMIDMGYGSVQATRWQPGPPTKAWHGSIKVNKKKLLPVQAHRCEKCGLLEFYAH